MKRELYPNQAIPSKIDRLAVYLLEAYADLISDHQGYLTVFISHGGNRPPSPNFSRNVHGTPSTAFDVGSIWLQRRMPDAFAEFTLLLLNGRYAEYMKYGGLYVRVSLRPTIRTFEEAFKPNKI